MQIVEAEFDVRAGQESIREIFEQAGRRKKACGWSSSAARGLPPALVGDEARLRQILFNLVGNAIKFIERGEILVGASLLPGASDSAAHVLITVSDTGIGISDEQLKDVFEPFVQGEGSYSRRFQGRGPGACPSSAGW